MIKQVSLIGLTFTLIIVAGLLQFGTKQQVWGCIIGGGLMTTNLVVIIWAFRKIFQKKSVALAVTVIVFKYAALIGLFVLLNTLGFRVNIGFLLGISVLLPTLGFLALQQIRMGEDNGSF